MTKPRFQCAVYLDADDMAFVLFAEAKKVGKSRADVIRTLIAARRVQYQAGFNAWLMSPEGRNILRAEGLDGLVKPVFETPAIQAEPVEQAVQAAQDTGIEQVEGESGS